MRIALSLAACAALLFFSLPSWAACGIYHDPYDDCDEERAERREDFFQDNGWNNADENADSLQPRAKIDFFGQEKSEGDHWSYDEEETPGEDRIKTIKPARGPDLDYESRRKHADDSAGDIIRRQLSTSGRDGR